MFYVSNKEKPYWYKVRRVKKGTSSKGDPYTFIAISTKDKQDDDKWKNATLYVWKDIDVKEGDSVAIYSINGVNYKENESGFKKFIDMQISTDNVKIKVADDDSANKSNKQSTASAPAEDRKPEPQPSYGAQNNNGFEDISGDDDLPF